MSVSLSIPTRKGILTQIFVCLPCYNESENLPELLQQIHTTLNSKSFSDESEKSSKSDGYKIIAVDDGSIDGTGELLEDYAKIYPIIVVHHSQNRGLAETYKTIINTLELTAKNEDIAIFMDADNTHPTFIIPELIEMFSEADIVVASRYKNGKEVGVPLKRRVLSKIVNWLVRNFCNVPILDCTSGFRAYRVSVLKDLPILESKGFEISSEILIALSNHKPSYNIQEIPLMLQYDRKKGPSKIRLKPTIKGYIKLFWKYGKINLTPFFRRITYGINQRLGKTYDKDPVFWNDGIMALTFLIFSFFIYDNLTRSLPQIFRFFGYVGIAFTSFCFQHILRRFWIFQN
jgi:dolichol-phosphate mannosyltransferase